MRNFEKLTEENMEQYSKFQKAAFDYAEFLIQKRRIGVKQANDLMSGTCNSAAVQVNSIKSPEFIFSDGGK